jgi:hypothetical protein
MALFCMQIGKRCWRRRMASASSLVHLLLACCQASPPAWRALQLDSLPASLASRGSLQGTPPCLATLRKVGRGQHAAWRLGSYAGELALEVHVALDRNPEEPCCKLEFVQANAAPHAAPHARRKKVGHVLLVGEQDASVLKGVRIDPEMRGRGLCRVLIAMWLRMCLEARIAPATRVINKPLLSWTLSRFGFTPCQRGQIQALPKRVDGDPNGPCRIARVRTAFSPPEERAALENAVCEALGDACHLDATAVELRRALTLRGGL